MSKEKGRQQHINTGGGAYFAGNVSMGNGNKIVGRDDYSQSGINSNEAEQLFRSLYAEIDRHPSLSGTKKVDLKAEIEEVRGELANGDQTNESFIMRRFRNIARMAPDILELTLATITSPLMGLGKFAQQLARKAQDETR